MGGGEGGEEEGHGGRGVSERTDTRKVKREKERQGVETSTGCPSGWGRWARGRSCGHRGNRLGAREQEDGDGANR